MKFTMHYSNIATDINMKIAVLLIWLTTFMCEFLYVLKMYSVVLSIGGFVTISCIVFIAFAYMILYRETRRHLKKIKARQLSQEEWERFNKENKALKTTVFVVGVVVVCLLPLGVCLVVLISGLSTICPINEVFMQTFSMSNSLVNPLIYC